MIFFLFVMYNGITKYLLTFIILVIDVIINHLREGYYRQFKNALPST